MFHRVEPRATGNGSPARRGFTMIEVLLALAILAVLATTVLASRNRFLALASRSRANFAAVELASRLLDETMLATDVTALEKSGETDEPFALTWSRRAAPYDFEGAGGLFMVDIEVRYGKDKDDEVKISVVTGTPKSGTEAAGD